MDHLLARNLPELTCRALVTAPEIDGKLDDAAWKREPDIPAFVPMPLARRATVETQAWVGYDRTALYVAWRCHEPNMAGINRFAKQHDGGDLWLDDTVELFIDVNHDRKTYYKFAANTAGVRKDVKDGNSKWNGDYRAVPGTGKDAWFVEMAIPWKTLGLDGPPARGTVFGLNVQRNHWQQGKQILQWAPTLWRSWRPELFGHLKFE